MNDWRIKHGETIRLFLQYLNQNSDNFILKGGTALLVCYKLDRFSEDIDLDGCRSKNIGDIVDGFCKKEGFSYRIAKDTDTVKRYMINYGNEYRQLKIEISFRMREISDKVTTKINGIRVYDINRLGVMKANAYSACDKIRDLYDLAFICNNYYEQLSEQTRFSIRDAVGYKGIEQFDYLVRQQSDELICTDKLVDAFHIMYDKLGLLYDTKDLQREKDAYHI